jgi:hypothetical protein
MDRNIFRYILRHSLKAQILILGMTVGSFPFLYATLELPKIIINDALAGNGPRTVLGMTFSQVHYLFLLCGVFLALVLVNGSFKYVINLQWDVYQMGLRGTIDPDAQPELAGYVLEARQAMRERLRDPKLGRLVERFDFALYNSNVTLAEKPIFGTPTGRVFDLKNLAAPRS